MATVSINVPNPMVPRVREAARALFPQYGDLTDTQAFQEIIAAYVRGFVRDYEAQKASEAARIAAFTQAVTDTATIV